MTGKGFDEFCARFLDWIEPWETYQPSIEQILDLEDRVVEFGRDRGRVKGTYRDIGGRRGWCCTASTRERVTRVEYYFDRDEGLRAAGLNP